MLMMMSLPARKNSTPALALAHLLGCCTRARARRAYSDAIMLPGSQGPIIRIMQGAGGRSSRAGVTATIFGCTGMLGRAVTNLLSQLGYQLVLPWSGSEERTRILRQMGDLGQLTFPKFNIYDGDKLLNCVRHSDLVINLLGSERKYVKYDLDAANAHAAENIAYATASAACGAHLIYVSHISAAETSRSRYLRSKFRGEQATRKHAPHATIVRCSSVFGDSDALLSRFQTLSNFPLYFPLVSRGDRILRPISLNDVARAITYISMDTSSPGKDYELFHPTPITEQEAAQAYLTSIIRPRTIVQTPVMLGRMIQFILRYIVKHAFHQDTPERLEIDEQPSLRENIRTFADAGVYDLEQFQWGLLEYVRTHRYRDKQFTSIRPGEQRISNMSARSAKP